MKLFKRNRVIISLLAICAIVTAFLALNKTELVKNPAITAEIEGPDEVKAIFKSAYYDFHSKETKIRWYNKLPFVSELVKKDVTESRSRFNFSD